MEILPLEARPRTHKGLGPHEPDPRLLDVAERVVALIREQRPDLVVEHVGSTAVPGLAGKGVVDLMIAADPGGVPAITDSLFGIGFQPQTGRDPFPATRPMLEGIIDHEGAVFDLHCHVIPTDDPEVVWQRAFRDRLREDAALRDAYVAEKRRIVQTGVTDSLDYSNLKDEFVEGVLRDMGLRS
jgi:GrpB-like predicted nucleotidyltransferase (UPF0157 family)